MSVCAYVISRYIPKKIPVKSESESHSVVSNSVRLNGLYSPWNSPGQNPWVSRLSLLQGIFPNQGLNPSLPHYRWILYQLSHKGNLTILEWVAYPFSRGSSRSRNQIGVSCIAGGFFTSSATRGSLLSLQQIGKPDFGLSLVIRLGWKDEWWMDGWNG